MAEIKVTYARLRETADAINTSSKDYRTVVEEIKSIMDTISAVWDSDAADQFRAQFQKLNGNFDSFEKVLNQYSVYLNKTADEYMTVDQRTAEDTNVLDGSALFV